MLDLRWPRRLSGAALTTLVVVFVASTLTASCEKKLNGPKNEATGGGAGATSCDVYRANCLTPEVAWQRYNAYESAADGGESGMGGEAGAGPVPDGCPPHDGNGPLVSSPPTSAAASCCYDLGDSDRCE